MRNTKRFFHLFLISVVLLASLWVSETLAGESTVCCADRGSPCLTVSYGSSGSSCLSWCAEGCVPWRSCVGCDDGSEVCIDHYTELSPSGVGSCAPGEISCSWYSGLGSCPGGGDRYPCEARNMTCPASCNLGESFNFSYEVRRTDSSYPYLGRQLNAWRSNWYKQGCWDTTSYSSTWTQINKSITCDSMANNGVNNNMNLLCYAEEEAGTYCNSDTLCWIDFEEGLICVPDPNNDYDVSLGCKVDVYCAPDEYEGCCDKTYDYFEDASATLGDAPGDTCLGATDDSCWAGTGGFTFPDTLNGEVYNDSCCGDDAGEYFVSDSGIFQGSRTITNTDRSCDGTTACCRSDSGDYNGYVKAGSCVDVCSPTSIGHIRIQGPSGIIKLNIISAADAISAGRGVVKVAMSAGDTNSAADLVETADPEASPVRIMTPYGIKAWREID